MQFQNGSNKVVIELWVVQLWSKIILVISNRIRTVRSFDFEITRMISDQIALHSVQLPLLIKHFLYNYMYISVLYSGYKTFTCYLSKALLQVTTLENGLKVASLETHSPKSRVGLFINAASRHETPSQLGISHILRNAAFMVCAKCTVFNCNKFV